MRASLAAFALFLLAVSCGSQSSPPKYVIGVDILGSTSCADHPVFIGSVLPISPAASAGLQPGDQLLSVDGEPVRDFKDASTRIASSRPDKVTVQVRRTGDVQTISVSRQERMTLQSQNGFRFLDDGSLVGTDYTDAEIKEYQSAIRDLDRAISAGDFLNVFPGHYPADKRLYYPGFEIFVWNQGSQVRVGGIENGPAKTSGVRWGDRIILVNGKDPNGKSLAELESLFSSPHATAMQLLIERAGVQRTYSFQLQAAARVLKANRWKMSDGKMIPLWLPAVYKSCF
jgi:C-terminal processing protease CtpA/Prc